MNKNLVWPAWTASIAVPLLYLCIFTPVGMDTTDFGYFFGYAWRILEGEVPYRDFYYIKPALPLYWHAFWMKLTPDAIEVFCGKAGFLAAMLASAWFTALFINRFFNLASLTLPLPLLATVGFVWGVHCFPHMPWHTVDGVLFGSASLWLAGCGQPFLAGLLGALPVLCKQSFLLFPLALLIFLRAASGWPGALKAATASCLVILIALALLKYAGAFHQFMRMSTGQLAISEALDAGVGIYLRQNWLIPALALSPWLIAKLKDKKLPEAMAPGPLYLMILSAWCLHMIFSGKVWIGYGTSWPTLFVLLGLACVCFPNVFLKQALRRGHGGTKIDQGRLALGTMLVLSWSVAISGGYKIPAFFATPLIFSFFLVSKKLGSSLQMLAWLSLLCGMLIFGMANLYPYTFPVRPLGYADHKLDAGKIYKKASGVRIDRPMYEKLAELKELRMKYGPDYKTLPGFTLAYYLNGDRPVFLSDWLIDWEINGETEIVYDDLLKKGLTIFMEKDQMDAKKADAYDRAAYTVPQKVRHEWEPVEETRHFIVFQPPKPQ